MPADYDLRRGLPMLGGDVDDRGLAKQTAAPERAPGFRFDPALVVKRPQYSLLKARVKLNLVDRGRDSGLSMIRSRCSRLKFVTAGPRVLTTMTG